MGYVPPIPSPGAALHTNVRRSERCRRSSSASGARGGAKEALLRADSRLELGKWMRGRVDGRVGGELAGGREKWKQ